MEPPLAPFPGSKEKPKGRAESSEPIPSGQRKGSRPNGWPCGQFYALLVILASFLVLLLEVVSRYVFGSSLEWSDEIARLLLVWITFTGAGMAIRERREIFVQTFRTKLSAKGKKYSQVFLDLLVLAFNLFLLLFGLRMIQFSWDIQTESLEIPFSFFYAAIPLGSILSLFFLGKRLRDTLRGPLQGGK
jgi:TRAP-type C4-dicarboxylate transport system permease small subunit